MMKNKMIGILVCAVLLATIIPITHALSEGTSSATIDQKDNITKRRVFTTCYIEVSGSVSYMWKTFWFRPFFGFGGYALVSYWTIVFDEPDVKVTIYSRENGRVLWQDNKDFGQWGLKLIGYFGIYKNSPFDDSLNTITLRGTALLAMTMTE